MLCCQLSSLIFVVCNQSLEKWKLSTFCMVSQENMGFLLFNPIYFAGCFQSNMHGIVRSSTFVPISCLAQIRPGVCAAVMGSGGSVTSLVSRVRRFYIRPSQARALPHLGQNFGSNCFVFVAILARKTVRKMCS